jgi:cobalt/nickel transport system permease protein
MDDRKVPLMGVLGAFVFASQMINFTIPATGSSGHLGGGMILAVLLGPCAAFLTMASILTVQALFFADGGLLALGCNIFNLGFFPAFVAYPLIYRRIVGGRPTPARITLACLLASVVGLQLGAFGVVLETVASGVSELPFKTFVFVMQPIHLAIGVVEGLVTAAVVTFVWKAQPEILGACAGRDSVRASAWKKVLLGLGVAALLAGGVLSWFASTDPDGLEWTIARVTGRPMVSGTGTSVHERLAALQKKLAFLPDYGFRAAGAPGRPSGASPAADAGRSLSGVVGGAITLAAAALIGWFLRRRAARLTPPPQS